MHLKDKITIAQQEKIPYIWNVTICLVTLTSKCVARVCQHQLSILLL